MSTRIAQVIFLGSVGFVGIGQLIHLFYTYTPSDTNYCTIPSKDRSLNNDCLRSGVLWPSILLVGLSIASFALVYNHFIYNSHSYRTTDRLKQQKAYARYLQNGFVMRDNRTKIGILAVLLSIFHSAILIAWVLHRSSYHHEEFYFIVAMAESSVFVTFATLEYYVRYLYSDRFTYAGVFPLLVPATIFIQVLVALTEIYFTFFTPEHSDVPFLGSGASSFSRFLLCSAAIGVVLLGLHSLIQYGPIFVESNTETEANGSSSVLYLPLFDEVENTTKINDYQTPLSQKSKTKNYSPLVGAPEYNVSWFSRATFAWLKDILIKSSRQDIDISDTYALSSQDMPIEPWKNYRNKYKKGRSLIVLLIVAFAPELGVQFILSILESTLLFSGPFFLQRILQFIEADKKEDGNPPTSLRSAYLDAFGLLVFMTASSVISGQVMWIGHHIVVRVKGMLVGELSAMTLSRHKGTCQNKKDNTNGEDTDDDDDDDDDGDDGMSNGVSSDGKVMNLLTADFERVAHFCAWLDELYSPPFIFIAGVWYLYSLIGVSAIVGISISVVYYPISRYIASRATLMEEKLSELSDERIAAVTELLQGIKTVKLFGWESKFIEKVTQKREAQLRCLLKFFYMWVVMHCVSMLFPMLVLVVVFGHYILVTGNQLTAEMAFTTISVFNLIRMSFDRLPEVFSLIIGARISLNRIDSYLNQPQIQAIEERIQSLGSRLVNTIQEPEVGFNDCVLGFENASLEWDVSSSQYASELQDITEVGTPNSDTKKVHTSEQAPLLSKGSQGSVPLSASRSYNSLNSQMGMTPFSLKNLSIRFPKNGLSIIAGPTGSGKSSLLSALIGEMTLTHGRILIPTIDAAINADKNYRDVARLSGEKLSIHNIAYVSQEAWLRNATIRENILFGEPYIQSRYEEVIRTCALKPDLRILTAGDQTEIGERGVTLSGGQKQRVALARAVYSSHKILLIDDCLSAVDAHTAKHILNECLLSKTDLMKDRTCVLVTHHVSMCLPHCQYIVTLRNGKATFEGKPSKLQSQKSLARVLTSIECDNRGCAMKKKKSMGSDKRKDACASVKEKPDPAKKVDKVPSVQLNDTRSEDEYNTERLEEVTAKRSMDPTSDLSVLEGTLVDEEERSSGYVKLSVWTTYFRAVGNKWFWITIISLSAALEATTVLQDYWVRVWVNATSSDDLSTKLPSYDSINPDNHHTATYWLGTYIAIGCIPIFLALVLYLLIYKGGVEASRTLHKRLLSSVVHARPRFFDSTPVGRIINRFTRDIELVDEDAIDGMAWQIFNTLFLLTTLFVVTLTFPSFIIMVILIMVVYAIITCYYLMAFRCIKRMESNAMSPVLSIFGELVLGVSSIRAFGMKQVYIRESLNRINTHNALYYLEWAMNNWLLVCCKTASALISFSCAIFILRSIDWLDAGLAGFVLSYTLTFSDYMMWFVRDYCSCEGNMNAVERIKQYIEIDQEPSISSASESILSKSWPKSGKVDVDNLNVEYIPGVPVLNNVTFSVKHGEKIGVVGRTGAGKSTLSLAFMRFVEATKGAIILDGVDIATISLENLRRNVTIIPQDPVLFNGSIRYNLDPFEEYPDEIIWEALERSHLTRQTATECSEDSSSDYSLGQMCGVFNDLSAEIKENGQNLSLGQRQLVALARALVRRSKLVIMDEATASVDFDTDERIQRTIRGKEFADSTLFCVAHRLRTIIDYDRVLVLDKGRISEFDTPWNLLQTDDSVFRSMCMESGEFEYLSKTAMSR